MAGSEFQSKNDRLEKYKSFHYHMKNSLGIRVLAICIIVVLLPTFIYSFRATHQLFLLKVREIASEMTLIATSYEREMQHLITLQEQNLETWNMFSIFETLVKEEKPCIDYCPFFQKIAAKQKLSSLFYVKKDPATGKFLYFVSAEPGRIGTEIFFSEELDKIKDSPNGAFLAYDPISKLKEILFVDVVYTEKNEILGYLISGVPAEQILTRAYSGVTPYPFDVSLLDRNEEIFISSNPSILLSDLKIISVESIQKEENSIYPFFQSEGSITRAILLKREVWFGLKVPIKGTDFFFLIDIPHSKILSIDARDQLVYLILTFFGIVIFGTIIAMWLTKRMGRPLLSLSSLMEKVGQGVLTEQYSKDKWGFEINELGQNYNRMILSLEDYIKRAHVEKIAKETLEKEFRIGYEIQKTILPRFMPNIPGIKLAAGFSPAKEVGGDFYDVYLKEDKRHLTFSIADTSGKGISACLYSLDLRSTLRSFDYLYDNISDVVKASNKLFCLDTSDTGMFVTAWIGSYDTQTRQVQYTSCGHLPALLCRKSGEIVELGTPGTALGVIQFEEVIVNTVEIMPGDFILLYTDGIIEAHNKAGKLFGKEKLIEFIQNNKEISPDHLVNALLKEVQIYEEGAAQHDDVTMFVIKID